MGRKVLRTVAPAIEELQRHFAVWREAGRIGRRIPEELWKSATDLAHQFGVNRISKAIGLDYANLKRRVIRSDDQREKISPDASSAFVELAMDAITSTPECVIEFEGQRGKLTIRLKGHSPTEVESLAETLTRIER